MYSHTINKLPKRTTEILLKIPAVDIERERKLAFDSLQKELTVEGFRKGKVPKEIAEKHLSKESIYQELLKTLLTGIYEEIVKKENLQPVINPKIDLVKAKEGEDWEVKITIAEKPIVDLGIYKEAMKKAKTEQKKEDIWVPGKDQAKSQSSDSETKKQEKLNAVLSVLLREVKYEISDLIIEDELDRRLTQLVDDVRKIGLTVESYLKSKSLTIDDLKSRYKKEIEDMYRLEFILMGIADKENIKVEKSDLYKLFANIKMDSERKEA